MDIRLDRSSVGWFERELSFDEGEAVRFFVRYGGESTVHPGFSLGMCVEPPKNVAVSTKAHDMLFFVRDEDIWYLEGNDLVIQYNSIVDEIELQIQVH